MLVNKKNNILLMCYSCMWFGITISVMLYAEKRHLLMLLSARTRTSSFLYLIVSGAAWFRAPDSDSATATEPAPHLWRAFSAPQLATEQRRQKIRWPYPEASYQAPTCVSWLPNLCCGDLWPVSKQPSISRGTVYFKLALIFYIVR